MGHDSPTCDLQNKPKNMISDGLGNGALHACDMYNRAQLVELACISRVVTCTVDMSITQLLTTTLPSLLYAGKDLLPETKQQLLHLLPLHNCQVH